VAFNPDVAAASVGPVAVYPVGVGVGWLLVAAGDPDVAAAVPAVVASVPCPVAMLRWGRRNDLYRTRWRRSDTDDDLRSSDGSAGGEDKTCKCGQYLFLHG